MATPSLEDVKFINQEDLDCINGFIKQCQQLLPSDSVYYTIPSLVIHWILLYFSLGDEFDQHHKSFKLTQNNRIAETKDNANSIVLSSKRVNSGIHRWKIHLIKQSTKNLNWKRVLGIWKTSHSIPAHMNTNVAYEHYPGQLYGWIINANLKTNGDKRNFMQYAKRECVTGDIIEIILDLNQQTLSFICNGKDVGVAFDNVDKTEYRMFYCTVSRGDKIKLIS